MKFRRALFVASPLAMCLAGAFSLSAQSSQERGKQVVDQVLAALGGDRFLAMQDRVEEGRAYSFYREELSGLTRAKIYTRYLTRPEPPTPGFFGLRERQAFGKDEYSAVVFSNDTGYEITFRGARPMPAATVNRWKESTLQNVFYILRQRLGEPGLTFQFMGTDVFENQPVEIVEIADSENRIVTVYFGMSTKLPVRQVFYRRDPETRQRVEEVTRFSKYRDVGGGVMWPLTILRERDGEKIYQMFSDAVTINQDLKDDLFTLPGNIKILKPRRVQ
ncbi:MAG: hypothetical protein IT158_18395 [Bryobacterales bacterium]|nr:hypothetical protein [Bryobacterales bacterium]